MKPMQIVHYVILALSAGSDGVRCVDYDRGACSREAMRFQATCAF